MKKYKEFTNEGQKTPDYAPRGNRLKPDPEILEHIEKHSERRGQHEHDYEGFLITTNKRTIKFLILAEQDCCEDWGYFLSEDDFQNFYGSEVRSVEVVDDALNVVELRLEDIANEDRGDDDRMTNTMFVNFNTSEGLLQFVAYNNHNGYYGHDALFIVDDVVEKQERL